MTWGTGGTRSTCGLRGVSGWAARLCDRSGLVGYGAGLLLGHWPRRLLRATTALAGGGVCVCVFECVRACVCL